MILSGIVPFMSMNKDEMKRNIIYRKVNFNQPGWLKVSYDAKDLVARLLEKDPCKRISIEQALQHSWFSMYQ